MSPPTGCPPPSGSFRKIDTLRIRSNLARVTALPPLPTTALHLFQEFVPVSPDAARFWLEVGAGALSLLVVLSLLLRFFGSENARPGLLVFGAALGMALLAAAPAAMELYLLPFIPTPTLAGVDNLSQWVAQWAHHSPWPARTALLAFSLLLSLLLGVVPLTKWTFRVPAFLALIAWLAGLTAAASAVSLIRTQLPAPPTSEIKIKKLH